MADISGYLQNIRNGARGEDVRDSIINALDKINKDNPSIIRPLNVTANGTYAGEGGVVYNPVTVNVPEGASQALSLTDIKITENGEFEPDDGSAYRNITVEVPQYVNEIMTDEKVVYLEEGDKVYYALDDGYDGYSAVHVMSGGSGGGGGATYYVDFLNTDGSLLERVPNVPFGGGAVYHKPLPSSPGMRFVGWNPNPLNVKSNMEVYARFENPSYSPDQITDDWLTIAKKCQENPNAYNIGQWKMIEFPSFQIPVLRSNPQSYVTIPAVNIKFRLIAKGVDVLEGENGYANTTWLARGVYWDSSNAANLTYYLDDDHSNAGDLFWVNSKLRQFLQGQFTTEVFPQQLLPYIKRVTKYTYTRTWGYEATAYDAYPSTEWFWIPSTREIISSAAIGTSNVLETMGPMYYEEIPAADYAANCAPIYQGEGGYALTRSCGGYESFTDWQSLSMSSAGNGHARSNYGLVRTSQLQIGFCI